MSLDALLGTDRAYDPRVVEIRPQPGQLLSAANLRALLAGSGLLASHRHDIDARRAGLLLRALRPAGARRGPRPRRPRPPRRRGRARARSSTTRSSSAPRGRDGSQDPDDYEVMSTGNFHGEPLAFAADALAMAVAELASISERRTDRMLDPAFSRGLPAFLAADPGTNSGYMIAQYTAASLVSENKVLAHPSSVDTIPTSGNQEDHVSMGWTSCRKLHDVLANVRTRAGRRAGLRGAGPRLPRRHRGAQPRGRRRRTPGCAREVPTMVVDRTVHDQIAAAERLHARPGGRRRVRGRTAALTVPARPAYAHLGGRLATGLLDVTDDLGGPRRGRLVGRRRSPTRAQAVCARFADVRPAPPPGAGWPGSSAGATPGRRRWAGSAYESAVEALRGRIAAGDVYQANLCRVLSAPLPQGADLAGLAVAARPRQPRPVRGRRPPARPGHRRGVGVAGALPVARDGDVVESKPIKGTGRAGGRPAGQGRSRERDDRRPGAQRPRAGLRARARSTCRPCWPSRSTPGSSTSSPPSRGRLRPGARLGGPARRRVPARVGDGRAEVQRAAADRGAGGRPAGPLLRRGRLGRRRRRTRRAGGRDPHLLGRRRPRCGSAPGPASPGAATRPASGTRPS